ncbi:MAG: anti-sigma factor family protein [Planctomycetota bacterium]|jgi:anti-sigma factor RsiW
MNDELLHAYFDGELSAAEADRLEKELAADPALAARMRELRSLDGALDTLPGHEAPAAFTERVVARVRRGARRGRILRLLAPLAAAAAILVAVVLTQVPGGDPEIAVADYAWEVDTETVGSLALEDLEDEILAELEAT